VQRMQDYIHAHFREDITLRELARAAAYSPWQALRAFSGLTGRTPFAYLREVRLSAAALQLRDTPRSVLDWRWTPPSAPTRGSPRRFPAGSACRRTGTAGRPRPSRCSSTTPSGATENIWKGELAWKMKRAASSCPGESSAGAQGHPEAGRQSVRLFRYCAEVGCDVGGFWSASRARCTNPSGCGCRRSCARAAPSTARALKCLRLRGARAGRGTT
jgi:AraC-like DNA-binding protein